MCGIVGIVSKKDCIKDIVSGLRSLEYRGYDSSGVVAIQNNKFQYSKNIGKVSKLVKSIKKKKFKGNLVIAHTRWATHGKPSIKNSHPFVKDNCALVHNGIIENYIELMKYFSIKKENIKSDTDSEVIAEVFNKLMNSSDNPIDVIKKINKKIIGSFSFAFLVLESKSIYITRRGSPLVIGVGDNFNAVSSDVLGLPENTKETIFLEENDIAELNETSISIYDASYKNIKREKHKFIPKKDYKNKGNYKHFMEKEIFHQPESIEDTILNFADKKRKSVYLPQINVNIDQNSNVILVACGTAYHACMIAKYWLEELTNLNVSIDIASEYRYRKNNINKNSIGIVVSQSGETMDTLKCLNKFKKNKIPIISIVNVVNSSIARLSDFILPTLAGPEIGVASTKAFTSQLSVFILLSLNFQQRIGKGNKAFNNSIFKIHESITEILNNKNKFKKIAQTLITSKSIFYIGRGVMYPIALEGALKLKEITYKHCEGYAAGELKHGPLALIEKNIPVIALAPFDQNYLKLLSNIKEVEARGGRVIMITDNEGAKKAKKYCRELLIIPKSNFLTSPIIYSLPVQLIAYYLGVFLGTDVDQPRNLAKSVTVE